MNKAPFFLITVDTEGDNLWAKPQHVTTNNAKYISRFQKLCEKYAFRPTYLTNYEMSKSEVFIDFGKDMLKRNAGEIGMHLHAWDTPPLMPITKYDYQFQLYLYEYPADVMRKKIRTVTDSLENTFQIKILSHRAGRFGFNSLYARLLIEAGYKVDCSVTPHISWKEKLASPKGKGGPDYINFPENAYFLDIENIALKGNSSLLELPMTVQLNYPSPVNLIHKIPVIGKFAQDVWPLTSWLRPNGRNLKELIKIVTQASDKGKNYIEFMIHSSELMSGGSPYFKSDKEIEKLYDDLEELFQLISLKYQGATLTEYYNYYCKTQNN